MAECPFWERLFAPKKPRAPSAGPRKGRRIFFLLPLCPESALADSLRGRIAELEEHLAKVLKVQVSAEAGLCRCYLDLTPVRVCLKEHNHEAGQALMEDRAPQIAGVFFSPNSSPGSTRDSPSPLVCLGRPSFSRRGALCPGRVRGFAVTAREQPWRSRAPGPALGSWGLGFFHLGFGFWAWLGCFLFGQLGKLLEIWVQTSVHDCSEPRVPIHGLKAKHHFPPRGLWPWIEAKTASRLAGERSHAASSGRLGTGLLSVANCLPVGSFSNLGPSVSCWFPFKTTKKGSHLAKLPGVSFEHPETGGPSLAASCRG